MVKLSALDERVATALHNYVQSQGGESCLVTSSQLLRECPDINAHHTAVSHALRRLMAHPSTTINEHHISVRASTLQQGKLRNYRTVYYVTSIRQPEPCTERQSMQIQIH